MTKDHGGSIFDFLDADMGGLSLLVDRKTRERRRPRRPWKRRKPQEPEELKFPQVP